MADKQRCTVCGGYGHVSGCSVPFASPDELAAGGVETCQACEGSGLAGVPDAALECLVGHDGETLAVRTINALCKTYGYGRIAQLTAAIQEIWQDPEKGQSKWMALKENRLKFLAECREVIEQDRDPS